MTIPQITGTDARVGPLALVCIGGWLLFALQYAVQGFWFTAAIDGAVIAALAACWWLQKSGHLGGIAGAHGIIAAQTFGLVAAAMLSGQDQAVALWYLALVPLLPAYLLSIRATAAWTAVGAAAIAAVHLSTLFVRVEPEFVVVGLEAMVAKVVMAAVVLLLCIAARRVFNAQAMELERARDEAVDASRAKSDFLAKMSHEVRTPLNGVMGMAQVLLADALTPQQREVARTMVRSGGALLDVVNEILDYAKIEAGHLELEIQEFALVDLIEDVAELFGAVAHAKGLDLACHIEPGLPGRVLGDSARLRQVLANLVGNAVKFTDEGAVVIRVTNQTQQRFRFEVLDTGRGIGADEIESLFQPFTQLDASRPGTGLGLVVSQRLVSMMGGSIGVTPSSPRGTCFHFDVELKTVDGEVTETGSLRLLGKRALIALPEEATRTALIALLKSWGITVLTPDRTAEQVDLIIATTSSSPIAGDHAEFTAPLVLLARTEERASAAALASTLGAAAVVPLPLRSRDLYLVLNSALTGTRIRERTRWAAVEGHLARKRTLSILVAEDNPTNQQVIRLMLSRLGYEPDIVANGAEAVEAIGIRSYDLVLMDRVMPVMDGLEATRRIRSLPGCREIPIVAVTASAGTGSEELQIAAGCTAHISKPLDRARLFGVLDEHLHAE